MANDESTTTITSSSEVTVTRPMSKTTDKEEMKNDNSLRNQEPSEEDESTSSSSDKQVIDSPLAREKEILTKNIDEEVERLKEKVKVLEDEREKLLKEVGTWKDKYYRALADYHNYQKRVDEKIKLERQRAQEEIILKILPIIDTIERARTSITIDTPLKEIIKGFDVIQRQIQQQLDRLSIIEIKPEEGASFDPRYHEALLSEENDQHPAGTILQVLEKGYQFKSKVIRPAKVKVAREKQ